MADYKGHQAHLRKLAEKSAKAKETRKKNRGTLPVRKYHAGGLLILLCNR